jgi:hypothetical protein
MLCAGALGLAWVLSQASTENGINLPTSMLLQTEVASGAQLKGCTLALISFICMPAQLRW